MCHVSRDCVIASLLLGCMAAGLLRVSLAVEKQI